MKDTSMERIIWFDEKSSTDAAMVGGKGANLGVLTDAGFPVPVGFTVTTAVYGEFIRDAHLADTISGILAEIDFSDVKATDSQAARIRKCIQSAELSEPIAREIIAAYEKLGVDARVAVRSSGTAEDLEGASFAGQHDTYLHIRTAEDVLDAVKRCWASLWTARAATYRQHKDFAHDEVGIAVVVQSMIDSEVSGVMFTANPIAHLTDEICINASWGLGETVVSGMVTPDSYILDSGTLAIKEATLGRKDVRMRLDSGAGSGTVTESVPADLQAEHSLTDAQLVELAQLGRRVTEQYGGLPQDIEWALADDAFYLLQARPVTGTVLSWDEELDYWQDAERDPETVWNRTFSDDGWTGAVTPLFFDTRGESYHMWNKHLSQLLGLPDLLAHRRLKYYRGTVYWNSEIETTFLSQRYPSWMRPALLANANPFKIEQIQETPVSSLTLLKLFARIQALEPKHGVRGWRKVHDDYIYNRREEAAGKTDEELRLLSDTELTRYLEERVRYEQNFCVDIMSGYILYWIAAGQLMEHLVGLWYTGDKPGALVDLLSGTEEPSFTVRENLALWDLSRNIHQSPELLELFRAHPGGAFFDNLQSSEAGQEFKAAYDEFMAEYGHRGHSDRDLYFTRRVEDPAVAYRAIATLLNVDPNHDPRAAEKAVCDRKRDAYNEIVTNLRDQPLGFLKVEIFKLLNGFLQKLLIERDNERGFADICTFTYKRGFKDLNRRVMQRGLLDEERDFYFLNRRDLYDVLLGRADMKLAKAKIEGRKHNFDLLNSKEVANPLYLRNSRPIILEEPDSDALTGTPTSGGITTGKARVVKSLEQIDTVEHGEILVCNSTDPGWAPVFLLVSGAIFETGGAFAHCSLISREYGIPAVQLPGALHRIPDGATITLDGDTGAITIHDGDGEEKQDNGDN
jgi:rifampicin phosphotransferase